ncbi:MULTISPECIES: MBL fold metallo-hydrolase [Cyanophyceae]|uniref:MBL fold metallo-hydrolase n=1 Tax=Cyanophyceae TaxID=3028117 RepID=UPI00016DC7F9|nr:MULTISPECIES: MBL fold metallo-hydrolase [Cyanophyceae]ACA98516.1 metallo-beta-lactamase superfamily hydrolase [Picosynechococcus sp. PCC 7002]SMH41603.1 Glyoxylase, beta-lactamase superfamily II [Picosynechococcus sp. OG1]SMQ78607.1 Glyoxylase, beta-lactamase superfamily II [Synechococcus sp. 7002]
MATQHQRRSQNVPGDFYVDSSCIDCDTCRWLSPEIFNRQDGQSAVYHQPQTPDQRRAALQALLACPTASIATETAPKDLPTIQAEFPLPLVENIYYCGYHSRKSFGAASYFIQHPEGNILVDSPRFQPSLVKQLEALGGVRYLFLTHRDDVADHQKFHDHFGCDRLLHRADLREGTKTVETVLEGTEAIPFLKDCLIIPVPGHTEGHAVLLYRDQYLFTGDHLAFSARLGHLTGFRNHCWYSWTAQIESMKKLLSYPITWILPGHGRRHQADSATLHQDLKACIQWMESVA